LQLRADNDSADHRLTILIDRCKVGGCHSRIFVSLAMPAREWQDCTGAPFYATALMTRSDRSCPQVIDSGFPFDALSIQSLMPIIVAFTHSRAVRDTLDAAAAHRAQLVHCASTGSLVDTLSRVSARLVVVELAPERPDSHQQFQRAIGMVSAATPVLLLVPPATWAIQFAVRTARDRQTVDVVTNTDPQLNARLLDAVEAVRHQAAAQRIFDSSAKHVPATLHELFRRSAARCCGRLTVHELVKDLGADYRMLNRVVRAHRLPAIRQLISWHRALHAAHTLFHAPNQSVSMVAMQLDFASAAQLCHLTDRLLCTTPSVLRSSAGYQASFRAYEYSLVDPTDVSRNDTRLD